jgi:hypothetical protein
MYILLAHRLFIHIHQLLYTKEGRIRELRRNYGRIAYWSTKASLLVNEHLRHKTSLVGKVVLQLGVTFQIADKAMFDLNEQTG